MIMIVIIHILSLFFIDILLFSFLVYRCHEVRIRIMGVANNDKFLQTTLSRNSTPELTQSGGFPGYTRSHARDQACLCADLSRRDPLSDKYPCKTLPTPPRPRRLLFLIIAQECRPGNDIPHHPTKPKGSASSHTSPFSATGTEQRYEYRVSPCLCFQSAPDDLFRER